jgi:hypothetical protein
MTGILLTNLSLIMPVMEESCGINENVSMFDRGREARELLLKLGKVDCISS